MKFKKIGLSLGGGGGKGAYQTGVLKALHEYGFDDDIKVIEGTSIGALSIALFGTNLDAGERLWHNVSRAEVFTRNKKFNAKQFGLFSRDGLEKIINENIDLEAVSKIETPKMFVTATNMKTHEERIFELNGKTPKEIMTYMEASSAIPFVFVPAEIDGDLYVDGGLNENLPMKVLIEQEKCDLVFMIPLVGINLPDENTYPDTTVIDFKDYDCEEVDVWTGMLGFDAKLAKDRIDAGYEAGIAMLGHLIKIGLLPPRTSGIVPDKVKPAQYKRYYSIKDIPNFVDGSVKNSKFLRLRRKLIGKIMK